VERDLLSLVEVQVWVAGLALPVVVERALFSSFLALAVEAHPSVVSAVGKGLSVDDPICWKLMGCGHALSCVSFVCWMVASLRRPYRELSYA